MILSLEVGAMAGKKWRLPLIRNIALIALGLMSVLSKCALAQTAVDDHLARGKVTIK